MLNNRDKVLIAFCISVLVIVLFLIGFVFKKYNLLPSLETDPTHNKNFVSYSDDTTHYLSADRYIIKLPKKAWSNLDKVNQKYTDAFEFLIHSGECISILESYTGKTEWTDAINEISEDSKAIITIAFTNAVNSRAVVSEGNIYLNIEKFEQGISDIEHELTHIVMGTCMEGTLSEGFATYMATKVFQVYNYQIDKINPHIIVQNLYRDDEYIEKLKSIYEVVGTAFDTSIKEEAYWGTLYRYGYSYVDYLIETYGLEATIQLFNASGSEEEYLKVTKKDATSVKEEWVEYLKQYESDITMEEIIEEMTK